MGHESAFGLHEPLSFDGLQEPMKKQRLQEHQIRAVVKRLLEGTYRDNLIGGTDFNWPTSNTVIKCYTSYDIELQIHIP